MNLKKFTFFTATLMTAAAILTSCGEGNPLRSSSEDKKTVMTVGGDNVKFEEFRYFWLNNKRDLYGEGANLDENAVENLKSLVETNVSDRHALRLLAKDFGVELTADDKNRAKAYVDTFRATCGDTDAYKDQLRNQYLNEPFFIELTTDTTVAYALLDAMAEKGAIKVSEDDYNAATATDEVLCIKEIYVTWPSADYKDWAKGRVEEALAKLNAGEKFEDLMTEYSNYNPTDLPPEHGYYTMEYDALEEIWDAAKNLREGEYSGIIETDFGYHIVLRAKKDAEYMATQHDELYEIFRQSRFYEYFYEYKKTLQIEYTSFGEKLDLKGIE